MSGNDSKKDQLQKRGSLSYIEQSLKMTPTPPHNAPVTIYPGPKAANMNLSKADLEIAERLQKLRTKTESNLPTEEEMASRLAHLKGLPSDHYQKPSFVYQPPDKRTETEKSDDLLKQVMSEISLESRVPKPEDEISARLAKLRNAPNTDHNRTSAPDFTESASVVSPEGEPVTIDYKEVQDLLRQATLESVEASASLRSLEEDKSLQRAIAETTARGKAKGTRKYSGSSSSEERFSGDDDVPRARHGKSGIESSAKEKEEVDQIIKMYTQKAQQKKEKRKRRALLKKVKQPEGGSSSEELSGLSSGSDIELSTSESEKLSDSD